MLDLRNKLDKLELEDKQLKIEFKEYRIENDNGKRNSMRLEDDNARLKLEVTKLTQ